MTDARTYLAGIKERAEGATEGPWFAEGENSTGARTVYYVFHNGDTPDRDKIADSWGTDAEFIAASRTDLPRVADALLAVLGLHKEVLPVDESVESMTICNECERLYPCPTVKPINSALEASL